MTQESPEASVEPREVALFLVAFGLVPLLLASGFVNGSGGPATIDAPQPVQPPWSFALTPGWSPMQLGFIALAGTVLSLASLRPAFGLAAVVIGTLLGLAADLSWLTGFVRTEDQSFVSLLPQAEWRSRVAASCFALAGAAAGGFAVGAVVRRLVRHASVRLVARPSAAEFAAVGVAVVGGPLLGLVIAWSAGNSVLVVPEGSQIHTVDFTAASITVDPAVLRQGETRVRCSYAPDAEPWGAVLITVPQGADPRTLPYSPDYVGACGPHGAYGNDGWGSVADLPPGEYVWQQIDNSAEMPRVTATSPVVVVTP